MAASAPLWASSLAPCTELPWPQKSTKSFSFYGRLPVMDTDVGVGDEPEGCFPLGLMSTHLTFTKPSQGKAFPPMPNSPSSEYGS